MPLPPKRLDQITEEDLSSLVQNAEAENKVIDYKESLPGSSDDEKRKFLYDVSSFANTAGGHLVFGVRAKNGIPLELYGIENLNADAEKLRLHSIIQTGVQPRIPSVEIHSVGLKNSRIALIVRVPRSWSSPHMVTFKGVSKFYSRNSAGNYPLDVSEIRAAFLMSETAGQKIRSFRAERLAAIIGNETPVELSNRHRLVFHILPLISFSPGFSVDLEKVRLISFDLDGSRPRSSQMHVLSGGDGQFTFDGVLYREGLRQDPCASYTHVFRNGCIEVVDCSCAGVLNQQKAIFAEMYEGNLIRYTTILFDMLRKLEVEPPFFVTLSLLGVREYSVYLERPNQSLHAKWNLRKVDRDNLIMSEIVIEAYEGDHASQFKALFDPVWQACGQPGSENYDHKGKWRG